ncbi:MAG TPA: dienelactone hydrolase family protein [Candidatus Limnocylindria bacterium]|nr:dienelactone hydrolase family protein [Candidatus Limnocylindria bacterium]
MLLLHAWWGLNDDVRAYAKRLREEGFAVEMPDLYGDGRTADTIAGAEKLRDELESSWPDFSPGTPLGRARGAIDAAAARLAESGPYGIVAWSLGAFHGWELVKRGVGRPAAFVVHYGIYDVGDVSGADAPEVLGHVAEQDQFDPPEAFAALEAALRQEGVTVTHHTYPNTRHWFAEPSRPEYDRAAAELAWTRTLDLLRRRLGQR